MLVFLGLARVGQGFALNLNVFKIYVTSSSLLVFKKRFHSLFRPSRHGVFPTKIRLLVNGNNCRCFSGGKIERLITSIPWMQR